MFSFDAIIQKIKECEVHYDPWPHICIERLFSEEESRKIHEIIKQTANWEKDQTASRLKQGSPNVYLSNRNQPGKEIDKIFAGFKTPMFLKEVLKKFNLVLSKNYMTSWGCSWHKKGAKQIPHTDMHVLRHTVQDQDSEFDSMLTQQIYFPNKSYGVKHVEESGIWLGHEKYSEENNIYSRFQRVKQIKCNPGTYMCYPNSDLTYHEVPEQLEEFDRVSGLSRTLWNSKGSPWEPTYTSNSLIKIAKKSKQWYRDQTKLAKKSDLK